MLRRIYSWIQNTADILKRHTYVATYHLIHQKEKYTSQLVTIAVDHACECPIISDPN